MNCLRDDGDVFNILHLLVLHWCFGRFFHPQPKQSAWLEKNSSVDVQVQIKELFALNQKFRWRERESKSQSRGVYSTETVTLSAEFLSCWEVKGAQTQERRPI